MSLLRWGYGVKGVDHSWMYSWVIKLDWLLSLIHWRVVSGCFLRAWPDSIIYLIIMLYETSNRVLLGDILRIHIQLVAKVTHLLARSLLINRQNGILWGDISRVHTDLLLKVFWASARPNAISPQALTGITCSPSGCSSIFESLVAHRVLRVVHKIASVSSLASHELGLINFLSLVTDEYPIEL